MDKLRGMIINVLSLLDRSVYRTEIVKIIYMIDEMYYQHFGTTISGLDYKWDKFGPNSIDDGIVSVADELVTQGIVHMSPQPNQYGEISYLYGIEKIDERYMKCLSDGEKYVIRDLTCHFKDYSLPDLIQASKQTTSFHGVKQYELIKMTLSKKYQRVIKSLKADTEFESGVTIAGKEMVG